MELKRFQVPMKLQLN